MNIPMARRTVERMGRIILEKTEKRGINWLLDLFSMKRLGAKSKTYHAERTHRLAVFANDNIGHSINQYGIYEREDLELLFEFLAPIVGKLLDGVALDIGANIGNHSIFFSDYFSQIMAFEPNPHTYRLLEYNAAFRSNISSHNLGLGDKKGDFLLVENTSNYGGSAICENESNNKQTSIQVAVDILDDFLDVNSSIEFIKIDVEGFEEKVIRGASRIIQEHQPIIVFEQHEEDFSNGKTSAIEMLSKMNYKFCWSQSGASDRSYFVRRLLNFWELFFGRKVSIRSGRNIPPIFHPMLIGVPPRYFDLLNLNDGPD